ncbi:MAG: hypothetical protein ABL962_11975, partial [Fimbriimonadaceae bacterium]
VAGMGSFYASDNAPGEQHVYVRDNYVIKATNWDIEASLEKQEIKSFKGIIFYVGDAAIFISPITLDGANQSLITIQTHFPPSSLDQTIMGVWPAWVRVRFGNASVPKI